MIIAFDDGKRREEVEVAYAALMLNEAYVTSDDGPQLKRGESVELGLGEDGIVFVRFHAERKREEQG